MTFPDKRSRTCCFTGHRNISVEDMKYLKEKLQEVVLYLIENKNALYFGVGGARGFDMLAAEKIINARKQYPDIKLILVAPCENQCERWNNQEIKRYMSIRSVCDKVQVLSKEYYKGCMQARNRYLVDHSAVCVSYLRKPTGGTAYTEKYAQSQGLTVIKL